MDSDVAGRIERAIAERDEALLLLAKERELTNALRLHLRNIGESAVPHYPTGTDLDAPPLRYRLADSVNATAKSVLGPVHAVLRRFIARKDE